jgi:hypothetical protein
MTQGIGSHSHNSSQVCIRIFLLTKRMIRNFVLDGNSASMIQLLVGSKKKEEMNLFFHLKFNERNCSFSFL